MERMLYAMLTLLGFEIVIIDMDEL